MPRRFGPTATPDGAEVLKRLKALPGFGEQKAKIFVALLGKQYGLTRPGGRMPRAPTGRPAVSGR